MPLVLKDILPPVALPGLVIVTPPTPFSKLIIASDTAGPEAPFIGCWKTFKLPFNVSSPLGLIISAQNQTLPANGKLSEDKKSCSGKLDSLKNCTLKK